MKRFLRKVIFPAMIVFASVGAAYYVGWSQSGKLSEAEAQLAAPVPSPAHMPVVNAGPRGNLAAARTYISVADAKAQIADILAGNLPDGARNAQSALLSIFSQLKPADASVLAADLPPGQMRDLLLRQVTLSWVRQDAKAALDWISTLAPDEAQALLLTSLRMAGSSSSFGLNAQEATQYLDKLTDPAARNQVVASIASGLARTDPAGALNWLNSQATGDAYAKAVAAVFSVLVAPNSQFSQTSGGGMVNAGGTGLHDPAQAVILLNQVTDPAARAGAIGEIARGWATMDPAAAANWATSLPDTDSAARATALNAIVSSWAKNDPEAAVALVQKSGDPSLFLASAPALADSLAKFDPQGALSFVQSLPDGPNKDQALNSVLVNLAPSDFPTAWNIATNLPPGSGRDAAMASLVSAQANIDPSQAVNMIYQFPTTIAEQNATHVLTKAWMAQDPQAATAWMQTLPPDTTGIRTAAIGELISAQVNKDPATTYQWANTITGDETRTNAIQRVVTTWAQTDPAAALNALQSANITEAKRAAMTEMIQQAQARAR